MGLDRVRDCMVLTVHSLIGSSEILARIPKQGVQAGDP